MRGMFWGAEPTRDMETGATSSERSGKKQTQTRRARARRDRRALLSDAAPARRPATFQLIGAQAMSFIGPNYSLSQTIGRFIRLRPHNPEISEEGPDMLRKPQCFLGNVVLVALSFCFVLFFCFLAGQELS